MLKNFLKCLLLIFKMECIFFIIGSSTFKITLLHKFQQLMVIHTNTAPLYCIDSKRNETSGYLQHTFNYFHPQHIHQNENNSPTLFCSSVKIISSTVCLITQLVSFFFGLQGKKQNIDFYLTLCLQRDISDRVRPNCRFVHASIFP